MDIHAELTDAFDRGFRLGVDALSPRDRDLYHDLLDAAIGALDGYGFGPLNGA